MLKSITLFILLFSAALCAQEFPLGVWFSGGEPALDSVRALGCNWIQAYCGWDSADSRKNYEFILKNRQGLKVIAQIESHLHDASWAQRLVYEAEQPADSTGVKNYFARRAPITGEASGKYWQARVGKHAAGYLARDVHPNDLLRYGRREWIASFQLKISPSGNGEAPVARLEILRGDSVLAQREIFEKDFAGKKARAFEVRFQLPAHDKGDALDFRVWWHGRLDVDFDYMVLEDFVEDRARPQQSGAYQLFRGKRDAEIVAFANRFASAKEYPLVQRFYLKDEPYHSAYSAFRYVDQLIYERAEIEGAREGRGRAITATPNYAQNTKHVEASFERFVQEGEPHELFVDAYPIHADIPADTTFMPAVDARQTGVAPFVSFADYNLKLQASLDYMIANSFAPAMRVAQRHGLPWWYIAQAHGELCEASGQYRRGDDNQPMLRPPSPEEMRTTVYLALAHGAKGIFYFAYATFSDPNYAGCAPGRFPGLIAFDDNSQLPPKRNAPVHHASDYDVFAGRKVFTGYRQKYEGVRRLNTALNRIGPVLLPLEWQTSFSAHREDESRRAREHALLAVTSTDLTGRVDEKNATFVEVGVFRSREASYYLIVNRRGEASGARLVTLTLRGREKRTNVVENLSEETTQRFIGAKYSYQLALPPGEAALLRRTEE